MRNAVLCVFAAFFLNHEPCYSFRALGLFPVPIQSNFRFYENLLKQLASKGHEIHVVSHFPQKQQIPRYFDIDIKGTSPILNNLSIDETANKSILELAFDLYTDFGRSLCEDIMNHTSIYNLKNTATKYDIILMEVHGTDCLLPFADIFQIPVIGISSGGYLPWVLERMGNPDNPSYITNYFIPFNGKMILFEKLQVAFATVFSKLGYHMLSTIPSEMRARDKFGNDIKPLDVLAFNTSLLLVNAHFSLNEPKPTVPGLIEVGGLHIGNNKPLPSDLLQYIDTKHGLIYLSFGSVFNITTMAREKLDALIQSLEKLPETIFIKSGDSSYFKKVPKNFVIRDWFPQLDVLCNANTKLFITHGGSLSIQEAAHCGVPILGIPLLPDNSLLVNNYVSKGAGRRINYEEINEQTVETTLKDLLKTNTYEKSAKKLSTLYKDRPIKPLDNAIYWIEYIHKYGGAPQLRSRATDLIWLEYYLIDVAFVIGIVAVFGIYLMIMALNFLQNYFDTPLETSTDNNKKQKQKST